MLDLQERGYQGDLLSANPTFEASSSAHKAQSLIYCLAARLGLPLNLPLSKKRLADSQVWGYGPNLIWLCPQPHLVLNQAWIDALRQENTWPKYLALSQHTLSLYPDAQFLLSTLFQAVTIVPLIDEENVW